MFRDIRNFFTHEDKKIRDDRWIFITMLFGAICSLAAAFVLSVEVLHLARNPNSALSCSINAIVNCATVAKHPTNELFGFPNSFIGLMSEPVVITVAIAGLAGMRFPRLFMFTAQIFYTLGFVFALTLAYISIFIIQALCPWCLLVTLTTILVWFSITRYNIREDNLFLSGRVRKVAHKWIEKDYDKFTMAVLIFAVVSLIVLKYGNGLFS